MRISDWSSDVCSSDLVELSRKFGDLGEIRDHARRTLPECEALAADRELYARPRPAYLSAEAGRDGREVSDIAHIAFIEALCIDRCYGPRRLLSSLGGSPGGPNEAASGVMTWERSACNRVP